MTRVVVVRHGETKWHGENRYAGSSDVDLASQGMAQAAGLATWAASAGLSAVWSSDLMRARRTAEPCADRAAVSLHIDDRLRELDFGRGEGLTPDDMASGFPAERRAFEVDPVASPLPGGEDPVEAAARFLGCLADIAGQHPDDRVLVVTHSTVVRLALCRLIGIPLSHYRRRLPSLGNCALTEIRLHGGEAALLTYNAPLTSDQETLS